MQSKPDLISRHKWSCVAHSMVLLNQLHPYLTYPSISFVILKPGKNKQTTTQQTKATTYQCLRGKYTGMHAGEWVATHTSVLQWLVGKEEANKSMCRDFITSLYCKTDSKWIIRVQGQDYIKQTNKKISGSHHLYYQYKPQCALIQTFAKKTLMW